MASKQRCEGKRRQVRGATFGVFKCGRKAKGVVVTKMGFSESHPCCGDDECFRSIAQGYPADWKEFT